MRDAGLPLHGRARRRRIELTSPASISIPAGAHHRLSSVTRSRPTPAPSSGSCSTEERSSVDRRAREQGDGTDGNAGSPGFRRPRPRERQAPARASPFAERIRAPARRDHRHGQHRHRPAAEGPCARRCWSARCSPDATSTRPGCASARASACPVSDRAIDAIVEDPETAATSSSTRPRRSTRVATGSCSSRAGSPVIDLTPAKLGELCIPALNLADCADEPNLCMVTCGGQAAVPLAHCVAATHAARRVRRDRLDERLALRRAGDAHQHRRVPRDDRGGGRALHRRRARARRS